MNALLALGLYVVILTAGIDLSVGSVMALCIMLLAMADKAGWFWPIVLLIGPVVGTVIGIINGLGVTLLRLPASVHHDAWHAERGARHLLPGHRRPTDFGDIRPGPLPRNRRHPVTFRR